TTPSFTHRRRRNRRCRGRSPAPSWCRRRISRRSGREFRRTRACTSFDMKRWIGFLGSWALLTLALGLAAIAIAGETINVRDLRRLDRLAMIDQMIAERSGTNAGKLRDAAAARADDGAGAR